MAIALPCDLKFGQVGMTTLRVLQTDIDAIAREMGSKLKSAPHMLERAPIAVDLGQLAELPALDWVRELLASLRALGLFPVGIAYGTGAIDELARALDMPLFARFRSAYEPESSTAAEPAEAAAPVASAPPAAAPGGPARAAMHVANPVRSGQQVYARGRDLVILGSVSAGAEVIADGSIHVYGALRGRALAGALGDTEARIYCQEFRAELVSIAGQYKVLEDLPRESLGKPGQAVLDQDRLQILPLA